LWTRAPRTTMLSLEIKSDIYVASDALVRGRLAALASEAVSATRGRQTTPGELPNLSIIKQASSRIRRLRQIKTSSSSDSTFPLLSRKCSTHCVAFAFSGILAACTPYISGWQYSWAACLVRRQRWPRIPTRQAQGDRRYCGRRALLRLGFNSRPGPTASPTQPGIQHQEEGSRLA